MTFSEMVQVITLYNGNVYGPKLKLTPKEKEAFAYTRELLADIMLTHRPVSIDEQKQHELEEAQRILATTKLRR